MQVDISSLIDPSANWPMPNATQDQVMHQMTSEERLKELLYEFKVKIIQKLIPGLNKPGYEESKTQPESRYLF